MLRMTNLIETFCSTTTFRIGPGLHCSDNHRFSHHGRWELFKSIFRYKNLIPWNERMLKTNFDLRVIHITVFSACVCGRQLRFSREIENFLSLRWRSPLLKTQTAASSVNQPLVSDWKTSNPGICLDWGKGKMDIPELLFDKSYLHKFALGGDGYHRVKTVKF